MENIFKSASKLVFLSVTLTLCFLMVFGVITRQLDLNELVIAFIALTSGASGFYFANKGDSSQEYLGK